MRIDVRNQLEHAALAEVELNDTVIVLMSRQIADEMRVWSEPVQLMVEPTDRPGIVDLVVRRFEP